ncbi:flagellar biosynthesis anti-sigma factor FlgM [Tepidibacter formicigenes]|jgi:negative regulator of flagellin synthesis FlgM|uniref:Negative regulator of flagellin synthesis n=1 Tax=Tepidibacter formicigenes DSM 15518 TaxID=1123349 RepID=A0A1M6P164_9FIRM|nr:flagellar biosynthesis anti-sigma factor FlgM [Tepidibacter formicigenes]SHK01640.1 anti-sigma-28 factor, FlgM family [Tepidibacter formicigenes DSM 15518]
MKINNINNIQKIMKAYKANKTEKVNKFSLKEDKIEISQKGKDFQFALEAFKNTSDIRENKVNEIKNQLDKGIYKVDNGKIAKAMLDKSTIDWRG